MNEIRNPVEKKGSRGFQEFIISMQMKEAAYVGRPGTWANNWNDEGYIEARLDHFLGQHSG